MGTDNLFHKRKERKAELRRKRATKNPYKVILIVCEGEKTEPNYFKGLKKVLRLSNANIKILGLGCGPIGIVKYAIKHYKEEQSFDRVYCVFDKDIHPQYQDAVQNVKNTHLKGCEISIISSVPCFELWLLLHFIYTTKPFAAISDGSICDAVVKELRNYLPKYQKSDKDIFENTCGKLDNAIKNAEKLEKFNQTSGTDNTSTSVHTLVKYLRSCKK